MTVFRKAAFAALTSLACLPSIASASTCWYPAEARAAQVRGLQTMLMVGTLRCRHHSRASEYLYGDFIENQRGLLDANNAILRARFERESGSLRGQGAYDRFATALANQYSEQLGEPGFCATVHHYARQAARADRYELMRLADSVAVPPATGQCRPAEAMAAADARADRYGFSDGRVPPPPRVAVADPAAAIREVAASAPVAPSAEPVIVAQAAADKLERVLEVAQAPAPVQVTVQPAAQVGAPAAIDRDEALKAALVALESALTALQAASASMPAEAAPPTVEAPTGAIEVDTGAADPGVATNTDVPAAGTR